MDGQVGCCIDGQGHSEGGEGPGRCSGWGCREGLGSWRTVGGQKEDHWTLGRRTTLALLS